MAVKTVRVLFQIAKIDREKEVEEQIDDTEEELYKLRRQ